MDSKECKECGEEQPLSSYYKNKSCKSGFVGRCKSCYSKKSKLRYAEKSEEIKAKVKEWYHENKKDPAFMESERERRRRHNMSQEEINKRKEYQRGRKRIGRVRMNRAIESAKRRSAKLQRTASWANEQLIAAYYKEAKRLEELTGIQFHVDHIIPLQGELVSGLHVETNLQLLPAHENLGKSNSFDPELFCA